MRILARLRDELLFQRQFQQTTALSAGSVADKVTRLAHSPRPGWLTRSVRVIQKQQAQGDTVIHLRLCRHLDNLPFPLATMRLTVDTDPQTGRTRLTACAELHPLIQLSVALMLLVLWLLPLSAMWTAPGAVVTGMVWLRAYTDRNALFDSARQCIRDREREAVHHLQARPNLDNLPRYVTYTEPDQWTVRDDPRKQQHR